MYHGVCHLDTSRVTVDDDSADFLLEDTDQLGVFFQVAFRRLDGRRQMAAQLTRYPQKLGFVIHRNG